MDYPDSVSRAIGYARQVLGGDIDACQLVKLACERFLGDLEAAESGDSPWEFRPDAADRAMHFAGEMRNIKGPEAGKPLRLMDWQRFIFANVFGFVERGTLTRRFRQGIIFVPRGNGKTSIAAPIALSLTFMDGEGGAEGYAAAVTRDQARILFDTAREMVRRSPDFRQRKGVQVGANAVFSTATASKFVPVSSDAKALDGLNVQVAVCDEIASHKTDEVYSVLLTAMGKRTHPFLLSISTATGNVSGIGRQLWGYGVKVLEGSQRDDRLFTLIYTADDGDDHWDEATWRKVNPGWAQTVQPDAIRAIMRQARNNPAQESAAKTRHLNIWVGADEQLFSMRSWRECADPSLSIEDFEGKACYLGVDLASKTDLTAVAILFPEDDGSGRLTYTVFLRTYLNDAAVLEARNASYPGWAAEGYITVTPGNETDFSLVEDDIRDLCRRFDVRQVGFDPWQSTQMSQRLLAEDVPMIEYRATTANFSEPIKEIDAAMRSGRLHHDSNPVLEWAVGNTIGHHDARGNVFPRKQRPEQKIDPLIALAMAVGLATRDATEATSVYSERGALFF